MTYNKNNKRSIENTKLKHILIAYKNTAIELQQTHDKILHLFNVVGRNKKLPQPDCHFFDEEHNKWIWAYSKELIDSLQ